jgi:hypothetical protein
VYRHETFGLEAQERVAQGSPGKSKIIAQGIQVDEGAWRKLAGVEHQLEVGVYLLAQRRTRCALRAFEEEGQGRNCLMNVLHTLMFN